MVDPQNNAFNDNELLSLLAEIERFIAISECRNVILAGDMNLWFFKKYTNGLYIIRDFVNFAATYQDLYSKHFLEEFENVKK